MTQQSNATRRRAVEMEPGRIELIEPDHRDLAPGEARVAVAACGICGTDLHLLHGMQLPRGASYPVRPGHEVAGVVTEIHAPDHGIAVGDLVVLHPIAPCGHCRECAAGRPLTCTQARVLGIHDPGGLADEVVWRTDLMVPVNGMVPAEAAVLADAVATAQRAVSAAQLPPGGRLCVLGAGGVGTHVLELIRIADPTAVLAAVANSPASVARLEEQGYLTERGLDGVARRMRERADGPFDVVVDFTGSAQAPAEGIRMLRPGGTLVFGSVLDGPLDLVPATTVQVREITVRGVYSSTVDDLRDVVALAQSGQLDLSRSVTHTADLDEAVAAFGLLEERPPGLVRMVLTVGDSATANGEGTTS